jgi:hypothetical protein
MRGYKGSGITKERIYIWLRQEVKAGLREVQAMRAARGKEVTLTGLVDDAIHELLEREGIAISFDGIGGEPPRKPAKSVVKRRRQKVGA